MDAEELEKIWNQDKLEYTDGYTAEQREKIIEDVKREFEEKDTLQNASAVHLTDVLLQNMELGKYIDNAGDMFSKLYRIIPRGYRVWASPAELYDPMIYVSDAHPIEVIED